MYDPLARDVLSRELARAFLSGEWTVDGLAASGSGCLDRWPSWMENLAMTVIAVHRSPPPEGSEALIHLINRFLAAQPEPARAGARPQVLALMPIRPRTPLPVSLPPDRLGEIADIPTAGALADRLELDPGQLAWLADVRGLERTVTSERLRNYRYATRPRRDGIPRVIEAPKARLKEIQRWMLRAILDHVPAHDGAHGFTRGRSAVTHAQRHTGQPAVLALDLKDFFASVPAGRIYRIWRTLGYAPSVSHLLTGLSTNVVPAAVWETIATGTPPHAVQPRFHLGRQLATPHLPQGAPTSPALANLAAYRLDVRLSGLADSSGLRYSRYADDLTFSGAERLHRHRARFEARVAEIVRSEGFALNPIKSVVQSTGGRQSVCGVVVNARTNVPRGDYDQLKAILHNAARFGPSSQNRNGVGDFRAHLLGRISWVGAVNPARGRRLLELFARIDWETSDRR